MEVNVIIPSYRPDERFLKLLDMLLRQTRQVSRIIVMNTEKKYLDRLLDREALSARYPILEVHDLPKREFDHGGTRNAAAAMCTGEIFVCMTQDAMPENERLIEELTDALTEREDIVAAYARQLAEEDDSEIERFIRGFNYPEESCIKGKEQLESLGIKTFFCSNVCAAYKKKDFDALGGFVEHTIFNEDMIYAAGAVLAGKKIAYAARARVRHSHDYTCMQQFHRNFDNGVSQADHPELFAGISSESEGMRMVKKTAAHLWKSGKPWLIGKLAADSAAKYLGFWLGRHYRRLPRRMILMCSKSREYWEKRFSD